MQFFSAAYSLFLVSVTVVKAIPPPITELLESSAKAFTKGVDSIPMASSNNLESSIDNVLEMPLKKKLKIETASSPRQEFAASKDTMSPEDIEIDNAFLNIMKLLETSEKAPAKGIDSLSTTSSSTFKSNLDDANQMPLKKKQKLETGLLASNNEHGVTDMVVPSAPVKASRGVDRILSSEHLPVRNLDSTKFRNSELKSELTLEELLNDFDHLDLKIANPL